MKPSEPAIACALRSKAAIQQICINKCILWCAKRQFCTNAISCLFGSGYVHHRFAERALFEGRACVLNLSIGIYKSYSFFTKFNATFSLYKFIEYCRTTVLHNMHILEVNFFQLYALCKFMLSYLLAQLLIIYEIVNLDYKSLVK